MRDRWALSARIALCTLCLWLGAFTTSALGATYSVTTAADGNGSGTCLPAPSTCASLRQAVDTIDASPNPPDVIDVSAGDYLLTNGALDITASMAVDGAGAGTGAGATTIDGDGRQVFSVSGALSSLTLAGMNIEDSVHNDQNGGAVGFAPSTTATLALSNDVVTNNQTDDVDGGAIYFDDQGQPGALDITDSTIAGNTTDCCGNGAGIAFENGDAGTLTITGSTLSGNSAGDTQQPADGGALYFEGATARITNSTVAGNVAGQGGGMYLVDAAMTLTNDTIAGNALSPADAETGAGIFGAHTVTAVNSIVSGNTGAITGTNDCDAPVVSSDHSLELGSGCGFDLASGDPKLEPLGDNGGPTPTMALAAGSAAIDAGDRTRCPATDQRGFPRPDVAGTACDVGAYESGDPPTASITMPANGAKFTMGQLLDASYGCSPGTDGALETGTAGCAAPVPDGAPIDTNTPGSHSFTVTATDTDGQTASTTSSYTVTASPPVNVSPPSITGTPKAGKALSCSDGTWSNSPTSYGFDWSRGGSPIAGADGQTYTVHIGDVGSTLTCTVTASNAAGAGSPATSMGAPVPTPPGCPLATGRLSGPRLGLVKLGMTRAQARRAFVHSSTRGKQYEEFFCLTPIGVRVGYASPKLVGTLAGQNREPLAGRVVWVSTANPYYAINGIRPGASVAAARRRLTLGAPFHIGLNFWYLGPNGTDTAVLKVRHGIVEEIGIAMKSLTIGPAAQLRFMKSFD